MKLCSSWVECISIDTYLHSMRWLNAKEKIMNMLWILVIMTVSGILFGGILFYQSLKEDKGIDDWGPYDD